MEFDTLSDIAGTSLCCLHLLLDKTVSFLGTRHGRFTLFISKFIGLILDILALNAASKLPSCGTYSFGLGVSGIFFILMLIFVFERTFVFGFIWKFGIHPTEQYEDYILSHISTNEAPSSIQVIPNTPNTPTTPNAPNTPNTDELPIGWRMVYDADGKIYFQNDTTKQTQWTRPQPLPLGWRIAFTPNGRVYYQNEISKKTQWTHPNEAIHSNETINTQKRFKRIFYPMEDKTTEGMRGLWYGSLWNTSDFLGQIYKIKPIYDAKGWIERFYAFAILYLGLWSYLFIIATRAQANTDGTYGDCDGKHIDTLAGFLLFLSLVSTQIGILQHTIAFGGLYTKKTQNINGKGSCAIKCGICSFVIMVILIVSTIYYIS